MKKIFLALTIVIISIGLSAQPVPNLPSNHGSNGNQQAGGGAPVDGGFSILLVMGTIYAARKLFEIKTAKEDKE